MCVGRNCWQGVIQKVRMLLCLALMLWCGAATAAELRIAVASNFAAPMQAIAQAFAETTGQQVQLVFGATGKHYAQIRNGAPFSAFFAADTERPKLLEDEGVAQPGSRFTYAIGKLVLWSPHPDVVDAHADVLNHHRLRYLAVANPKLAPYGQAAMQVLRAQGVFSAWQTRMVRGENIGQTFQFIKSGNVELGFVALSQVKKPGMAIKGSYWMPPASSYDPIEQQAVLLRDDAVARNFLAFVASAQGQQIIRNYGYETVP